MKSPKRLVSPRARMIGSAHARAPAPRQREQRRSPCRSAPARRARDARRARASSASTRSRAGRALAARPRCARSGRWRARATTQGSARAAARERARHRPPRPGRARRCTRARSSAGVPVGDDAAGVEIDQAVAGRGLVEVAGAEQDQRRRRAAPRAAPQISPRATTSTPAVRLVEHQQRGLGQQRVRDGELLLHAARERARRADRRTARAPVRSSSSLGAPLEDRPFRAGAAAPVKRRFSTTESSRFSAKTCGT